MNIVKKIKKNIFPLIITILNLFGAILLAISVQARDLIKDIGTGFVIKHGNEIINQTETTINSTQFHWGIFLLILGSIIQIVIIFRKD